MGWILAVVIIVYVLACFGALSMGAAAKRGDEMLEKHKP